VRRGRLAHIRIANAIAVEQGRLAHVRVANAIRVESSALAAFVEAQRNAPR